jgi:hypothetical protein
MIQGRFTSTFTLRALPEVHARVLDLIEVLLKQPTPKDLQKVIILVDGECGFFV